MKIPGFVGFLFLTFITFILLTVVTVEAWELDEYGRATDLSSSEEEFISSTFSSASTPAQAPPSPQVQTPNGPINGKVLTSANGPQIIAFLGIPYATPPLGSLRFKPPIPYSHQWTQPYQATQLPNSCNQPLQPGSFPGFVGDAIWYPNTNVTEDCLFLNVWIPQAVFEARQGSVERNGDVDVATLIWIHGGALFFGTSTSDIFQPHNLVGEENVIVVSIQYRLGPLGFLFLANDESPGNVGLLDQVQALRWVNDNIKYFGGNPSKITLFGESAGGASAMFHLLSPLSQPYFNSAILMSPTYASRFQEPADAYESSLKLAMNIGCYCDNFQMMMQCLQSLDPQVLVGAQFKGFNKKMRSPFVATIDGRFLTDSPLNLLREESSIKRSNIMIGNTKNEGTFFIPGSFKKQRDALNPTFVSHEEFLVEMKELFKDKDEFELEAILNQYTNWNNLDDGFANQGKIAEAVGDSFLICPTRQFADEWSSTGESVYYYSFSQRSSSSPWGDWYGVRHTDEIEYVFGGVLDNKFRPTAEINLSKRIMKLFAVFAKTGAPSQSWETYTKAKPYFLDLNTSGNATQVYGPRVAQCGFWNSYLPKLRRAFEEVKADECGRIADGGSNYQELDILI